MKKFTFKNTDKKEKKPFFKRRNDRIVRLEEIDRIMKQTGRKADPEEVLSLYMPRKRVRQIGAALLRLDKIRIGLLLLIALIVILFIMSFMQEKMGNFTINLDRLEMFRKGISIAEDGDFTNPTARLEASPVIDATNITLTDLPDNLDEIDGDHNGINYVAYTYYVRNAGKEDVAYLATIEIDSSAKNADQAVRVAVWRNGERTIYAHAAKDGEPEPDCVNFESKDVVCSYLEEEFLVGNVDRYTIVIWMEGEDPECTDEIVGGSVQFSMNIQAASQDESSLLVKFVQDIRDTLMGDKPIGAAGTEAPNYMDETEITYENRRNQ